MIDSETTSPTAPWRDRTLCRLVDDVRSLLPASAVGFATLAEETREVAGVTGWFGSEELRDALCAGGGPGPVEAALERGRPLLLPRVDAWQAAPLLLKGLGAALGETRGRRAWSAFRSCSLIACPLRTETGRGLGVLVVASLDSKRPLRGPDLRTAEVVADLAAIALERAGMLEVQSRRARDELRLKRAGEEVSSSLELADVYRTVAEHAVALTGGTQAVLTRLDARAGELRTVARPPARPGDPRSGPALGSAAFGDIARTRRGVLECEPSAMHVPRSRSAPACMAS